MYCQHCGGELEKDSAVCPKCKQPVEPQAVPPPPMFYPPMYPMPFMMWRSAAAAIMLLIASMLCLIAAFSTYDYYILWYDEYDYGSIEFWIGVMTLQVWAFGMGLISAVLTLKRSRYLLAGSGYIVVVIAGAVSFVDFGPGFVIILPAIPALILFLFAKRDFDMPAGPLPPFPMPPPMPGAAPGTMPPTVPSPYDKMRELKKLKDDGIISEDEYEAKRKQMLDKL